MNLRLWIGLGFVTTACATSDPPPATPAPPPAVSTAAPEAGPKVVFTTESNTDTCRPFPVGSQPPFSTFDSREACETWVKARRCRPGFSCSDGCNTTRCLPDGSGLATTLLSCALLAQMKFEFQRGSSAAPGTAKTTIKESAPALQQVLADPSGTIVLRGQAAAADAKSTAARTKLSEARARAIRDVLVAEGISSDRVALATEPDVAPASGIVTLVAHADEPHRECKERPEP